MGCMMMRECTNDVTQILDTEHLELAFPGVDYNDVREETDALIVELDKMGVKVFLGDERYFVRGNAGVYYTVGNNFFMNTDHARDPQLWITTLRHEAWHAAQDAFAGTIENSSIAIIYPEESVPQQFVLLAEIAYPPAARPWEQEAKWAGATPGMTLEVLKIINETNNKPWTAIEPTPLTRKWLVQKGYL